MKKVLVIGGGFGGCTAPVDKLFNKCCGELC